MGPIIRQTILSLLLISMYGLGVQNAYAQDGSISGVVTEHASGNPLPGATVLIEDVNRGMATDGEGRYEFEAVAPGSYTLTVNFVGYRRVEREVEIASGEDVVLDVALRSDALGLDQLVVTGQAMGSARREIGSSVASIDVSEIDNPSVQSMSQLLQGRAPGMTILPSGGQAGQGSRLLLRGIASLSQANTPVIYIDGVRMDNSTASGIRTTGPSWSGLDDLNPQDIERIEVVRGASAATMYGTEAAAGVIQIFTKRGQAGAPQWNFRTEAGVNYVPDNWWNDSGSMYSQWFADEFSETTTQFRNQLSVSGGQEDWQYYLAGTIRSYDGILPNNDEAYRSLRSNVQINPWESVQMGLNLSYSNRVVQQTADGNNQEGITINGLIGGPGGQFVPPASTLRLEHLLRGHRYNASYQLEHQILDNLSHRLNAGAELFNADNTQFLPRDVIPRFSGGYKGNYRRSSLNLNLDYIMTYRLPITDAVESTTNLGFQGYDRQSSSNNAYGEDFPFLGLSTVSATSSGQSVAESRFEERSIGIFGEQQLGLNDMFYVTVGARGDAHSAFGEAASFQIYPKIDASYLFSEHNFWNDDWGSLRFRGSYGTAGMQPGAFDAVRTWSPIAAIGGEPAVTTGNVGNPDLRPEVSHEFEVGFDLSTLNDRLSIDLNYYNQRTVDALHFRGLPPSQGFLGTQLENIGEVSNQGVEISTTAELIRGQEFSWSITGQYAHNQNEVVSLGGGRPLNPRWTQYVVEGYPIASFFGDYYVEQNGEAVLYSETTDLPEGLPGDNLPFIGPSQPVHTAQLSSDVRLGFGLSMNVMLDYQGGHYMQDHTRRWLTDPRRDINEDVYVGDQLVAEAGPVAEHCRGSMDPVTEQLCGSVSGIRDGDFVVPADFLKLRELTFRYQLPSDLLVPAGLTGATVSLSGRNLWRWSEAPATEPEGNLNSGSTFQRHAYFVTPTPRQIVLGLNVQF